MYPPNYWKQGYWQRSFFLADENLPADVPTYMSASVGYKSPQVSAPDPSFSAAVPQSHKTAQGPSYNAEA